MIPKNPQRWYTMQHMNIFNAYKIVLKIIGLYSGSSRLASENDRRMKAEVVEEANITEVVEVAIAGK
jgi:hypothetical protein